MYQAILFDIDGTLLSINSREMMNEYFQRMASFLEERFPQEGHSLVKSVMIASKMMETNDSGLTNEIFFWQSFDQNSTHNRTELEPVLKEFYQKEFPQIGHLARKDELMPQIVAKLAQKGYPLIVATNPLFPLQANLSRLAWANVADAPWQEITSFEQYHHNKPNQAFFLEICQRIEINPANCLMIGNGLIDDKASLSAGMDFYLVTDEVKDGNADDYQGFKGSRRDLLLFVETLPDFVKII